MPLDMDFVNPDSGFLAGSNGDIYFTANGGQDWTVDYSSSSFITALQTIGETTYVIGNEGLVLKKIGVTTNINESQNNDSPSVSVFPNPVKSNEKFAVVFRKPTYFKSVKVIDLMGREHLSKNISAKVGRIELYLENLSSGVYFIQIEINNQFVSEKVVIQ
jgi:hypothetical protein